MSIKLASSQERDSDCMAYYFIHNSWANSIHHHINTPLTRCLASLTAAVPIQKTNIIFSWLIPQETTLKGFGLNPGQCW